MERNDSFYLKTGLGEKNITFKRSGTIAASRGRIILHRVLKTAPAGGVIYYDS